MPSVFRALFASRCHQLPALGDGGFAKRSLLRVTSGFAVAALCLLWNLNGVGQQPKPILPDPKVTPGDVFEVTIQDICTPGYSKKVRAVPTHLKKQA